MDSRFPCCTQRLGVESGSEYSASPDRCNQRWTSILKGLKFCRSRRSSGVKRRSDGTPPPLSLPLACMGSCPVWGRRWQTWQGSETLTAFPPPQTLPLPGWLASLTGGARPEDRWRRCMHFCGEVKKWDSWPFGGTRFQLSISKPVF